MAAMMKRTPAKKSKSVDTTWDMRKRYEQATVKCEFCGELFNTSRSYHDHARVVHFEEIKRSWLSCPQCDSYLASPIELATHKSKIHSKGDLRDASGRLVCEFCPKTYLNMLDYNKHCHKDHYPLIRQEWISCPECELCFRSQLGLQKHTLTKHKKEDTKAKDFILCSFCPKRFTKVDPMYQHANRYHLEEVEKQWYLDSVAKLYKPKETVYEDFVDVFDGARTVKRRSQGPKLWCEFCSMVVTYSLIPHANKKHADIISKIWLGCQACKMYFPNEKSLNSHRMSKHWSTDGRKKKRPQPKEDKYQCQFCDARFSYRIKYWAHAQKVHCDIVSKTWIPCTKCDAILPDSRAMGGHMGGKHSVKYDPDNQKSRTNCEFCTASFSKVRDYTRHANRDHHDIVKEKWLLCPDCSHLAPNQTSLFSHRVKCHKVRTAANTIICEFCPDTFPVLKNYARHATQTHLETVAQTWEFCSTCSLYYPSGLHDHSGGKIRQMAECKFCCVTFPRTKLTLHCNQEHLELIKSEWYPCNSCNQFFPSESVLNTHIANRICIAREEKSRAKTRLREQRLRSKPEKTRERKSRARSELQKELRDLSDVSSRPKRRCALRNDTSLLKEDAVLDGDNDPDWEPVVKIEERMFESENVELKKEPQADNFDEEQLPLSMFHKRARKCPRAKVKEEIVFEEEPSNNLDISNASTHNSNGQSFELGDTFDDDDDDYEQNREFVDEPENEDQNLDDPTTSDLQQEFPNSSIELAASNNVGGESQMHDEDPMNPVDRSNLPKVPTFIMHPMRIDFDQLPIQPDDYDNTGYGRKKQGKQRLETSSGKNATYSIPEDSTEIRLVTSVDKNGIETKRVQCEYCTKSHINTSIYIGHVNKEHQEMAMVYWSPCNSCDKYFPSEAFLKRHQKTVHYNMRQSDKPKILCHFCSRLYGDSGIFYKHVKLKHYDEALKTWVKCKLCDTIMPHETAMYSHVLTAHPKYHRKMQNLLGKKPPVYERMNCVCDFCDSVHAQRSRLLQHIRNKHAEKLEPNTDAVVICQFCGVTKSNFDEFCFHANQDHQTEIATHKWVSCTKCRIFLPSETRYAIHRSKGFCKPMSYNRNNPGVEDGSERVRCEFCFMTFMNKTNYYFHANKNHRRLLQEADWDHCEKCDKYIPQGRLDYHKSGCKASADHITDDKMSCRYCQMVFSRQNNLVDHSNNTHKDQLLADGWLPCTSCHLYFPDTVSLNHHLVKCNIKIVDRADGHKNDDPEYKFQCNFCHRKSKSHGNHMRHVTLKHRDKLLAAGWFPCQGCERLFVSKHRQLSHQRLCMVRPAKDTQPRQASTIPCTFCPETFIKGQMFYAHANKYHQDKIQDKWEVCSFCSKYFPDKTKLRRHRSKCDTRSLQSSEPYKCDFCPMEFKKINPYMIHANKKHLKEVVEAEWLHCQNCNKFLRKSVNFKRHLIACLQQNQ